MAHNLEETQFLQESILLHTVLQQTKDCSLVWNRLNHSLFETNVMSNGTCWDVRAGKICVRAGGGNECRFSLQFLKDGLEQTNISNNDFPEVQTVFEVLEEQFSGLAVDEEEAIKFLQDMRNCRDAQLIDICGYGRVEAGGSSTVQYNSVGATEGGVVIGGVADFEYIPFAGGGVVIGGAAVDEVVEQEPLLLFAATQSNQVLTGSQDVDVYKIKPDISNELIYNTQRINGMDWNESGRYLFEANQHQDNTLGIRGHMNRRNEDGALTFLKDLGSGNAPSDVVVDDDREVIYYSVMGNSKQIRCMDFDGSNDKLITNLSQNPLAIEYDSVQDRIYFLQEGASGSAREVRRMTTDGSAMTVIRSTNINTTIGMAIDTVGEEIYLVSQDPFGAGQTYVMDYDGGNLKTIADGGGMDIEIDVGRGDIYYANADSTGGKLSRKYLNGSGVEDMGFGSTERWESLAIARIRNAQFFFDSFTDTDGVALTDHTSDSGHTWSFVSSGSSSTMEINSNRVKVSSSAGDVYNRAWVDPGFSDGVIKATFTTPSSFGLSVSPQFGIFFRLDTNDPENDPHLALEMFQPNFDPGTNAVLRLVRHNPFSVVSQITLDDPMATSTSYIMVADDLLGSDIVHCSVGTSSFTFADDLNTLATGYGFYMDTDQTIMDNFSIRRPE